MTAMTADAFLVWTVLGYVVVQLGLPWARWYYRRGRP